jgi:HPt (histidine-containing phosphotransfer) domain-containing protein
LAIDRCGKLTCMANINERLVELSKRYLQRSSDEVLLLREQLEAVASNRVIALKEIEIIAHRIRGSGAMFGFEAISDISGELEMLAVDVTRQSPRYASLNENLIALVQALESAIVAAKRERSV